MLQVGFRDSWIEALRRDFFDIWQADEKVYISFPDPRDCIAFWIQYLVEALCNGKPFSLGIPKLLLLD